MLSQTICPNLLLELEWLFILFLDILKKCGLIGYIEKTGAQTFPANMANMLGHLSDRSMLNGVFRYYYHHCINSK